MSITVYLPYDKIHTEDGISLVEGTLVRVDLDMANSWAPLLVLEREGHEPVSLPVGEIGFNDRMLHKHPEWVELGDEFQTQVRGANSTLVVAVIRGIDGIAISVELHYRNDPHFSGDLLYNNYRGRDLSPFLKWN